MGCTYTCEKLSQVPLPNISNISCERSVSHLTQRVVTSKMSLSVVDCLDIRIVSSLADEGDRRFLTSVNLIAARVA